ncbi:MAG: ABC transporter permease [Anaerolineaceae bacterium]|nr:ABC transporter permease [Anaerolineaceae bacterium]
MTVNFIPDEDRKPIVITPPSSLDMPNFRELWEYRDLLFFLTRRNLKVRFQQTLIGFLWIILQPLIQMGIFYFILGILAKIPTEGVPYPIFFLSGFVVWQLFSQVVNTGAYSLLENIGVIIKSYFPRLALPLSQTIGSLVDFLVSFLILFVFLLANHFPITARYFLLPVLLLITVIFSSGVGLLFGALMVVFRDTKNFLAFILMIWMYLTPVLFPISIVPQELQVLFYLNPLTSLVEAFRWVFLNQGDFPTVANLLISFVVACALWFAGAVAFRSMENRIADVL